MVICSILLIFIGIIKFLIINRYDNLELSKTIFFQIKDNYTNFLNILRILVVIDSIICLICGILILL
jgi:hypothetical protein